MTTQTIGFVVRCDVLTSIVGLIQRPAPTVAPQSVIGETSLPAAVREQRLRKTKAQLIDEIDTLEQRLIAVEATYRSGPPMREEALDRYLSNQALSDLARFPSENPSPVLRAMPDGTVLYANDAAIAVSGLLEERKKSMLTRDLAGVCAEASRSAEVQEIEFESSDRVFAFSITPLADETYVNIYGRDVSDERNTRLALEAANEASVAAEARLKAIIDNSPATICLKDFEGRYQLVNKHVMELYGMTADAMLGKTVHELFPEETADPSRSHDRRVLMTGVAEEREQVVTTPGGLHIFNWMGHSQSGPSFASLGRFSGMNTEDCS